MYFYSQAVSAQEARDEANFVLEQLAGRDLVLPVVYDLEDAPVPAARTAGLSGESATEQAIAFCETIRLAGYQTMVYMNGHWASERYDMEQMARYPIWYAAYDVPEEIPIGMTMWQYTDRGTVDGIEGPVDLNLLLVRQ